MEAGCEWVWKLHPQAGERPGWAGLWFVATLPPIGGHVAECVAWSSLRQVYVSVSMEGGGRVSEGHTGPIPGRWSDFLPNCL